MRIACFWGETRSLDRISFRHEHLIDGFTALGHQPVLVTARDLAGRFAGPTHLVETLAELERPGFWSELAPDLAVGVTWLRKAPILEALAAAGVPRIAIAESDGQVGYAAHPGVSWARIWPYQRSTRDRLRTVRYFVRRWRASRAGRDEEDREFLASARASSAIAFGSREAIAAFARFLARSGEEGLAGKAFVAPFPVPTEFASGPLPEKEDRVVAVGRWSDPQKDAPLLAGAIARYFARGGTTRIDLYGADGEAAFGELARKYERLHVHGVREPHEIREAMARSRALLLSSRWETGPHAAGEALALGATLVSTPLPNSSGFIDGSRFGTLAERRGPEELAGALALEMDRWATGERNPGAIAAHWRERLTPVAYCRALLEGSA